ncbi:tetratricopeptide repeat protein [Brevundimonas sp. S30B]|uniref:tetratricopeptide repeat protein n=1 Tax=unclassified Brevundimonas TaxID=2622653 RepID=UPI001072BF9F|nr:MULTISPECIES: tetratricopeptide repeat protein [unclassified Brevundimonas]QBX36350.1 tetratricopeptide repeat protein [Brevundimonas sp. MF30-B]TFW01059.1 tetratricopeptide repeat protein [Brevundimonas sp. S30B]
MTVSRSRLIATSMTVLALATAGAATAQALPPGSIQTDPAPRTGPAQQTPEQSDPSALPPAIIVTPPPTADDAAPELAPDEEAPAGSDATGAAPETPPIPETWAPAPTDAQDRSVYGLFLSGRNAMGSGEGAEGARRLSQALALAPEQPRIREQAFSALLLGGDLELAGRITPDGEGVSPTFSQAGKLVAAIQTYAGGDARGALSRLTTDPVGQPHALAALYALPWIAAEAGDWNLALIQPRGLSGPTGWVLRGNRALLLEHRRRHDEADAMYRELVADPTAGPAFRRAYAGFLERRGRRDDAVAQYDALIAAGRNELRADRERAASGGRAPAAPTLREGVAGALATAAEQVAAQGAHEFAAVYLRLALDVAPQDVTRLQLGQVLAEAQLTRAALAAWSEVRPADPAAYATARLQMALLHAREDEPADAVRELEQARAAQPESAEIAYLLAGQLMSLDRHEDALVLLNGPLLNTADQGFQTRFLRGAAYESQGLVTEAEAELWAALQQQPDNATALNYLGYLWVDSGRRVPEGLAMIERAHAAEPDNGNIQDSLGWGYYRLGRFTEAVEQLEGAVAKEPANAEINDHLGDAYWQVGRQREARFQWTRVLALNPDDERRAQVERKLAGESEPDVGGAGASI